MADLDPKIPAAPRANTACAAWTDCAYFAHALYKSADGGTLIPLCTQCSKIYKLDGFTVLTPLTVSRGA